jgi:hypothetical protein
MKMRALSTAMLCLALLPYQVANAEQAPYRARDIVIPMTPDRPSKRDRIVKPNQIRVMRATKFCIHTWFSPEIQKILPMSSNDYRSFSSYAIHGGKKYFTNNILPLDTLGDQRGDRFYRIPSQIDGSNTYCLNDGINIMLTAHVDINSKGTPYRIILAVRQGQKFSSVQVERMGMAEWPGERLPGGPVQWLHMSISSDISDLTFKFLDLSFNK